MGVISWDGCRIYLKLLPSDLINLLPPTPPLPATVYPPWCQEEEEEEEEDACGMLHANVWPAPSHLVTSAEDDVTADAIHPSTSSSMNGAGLHPPI